MDHQPLALTRSKSKFALPLLSTASAREICAHVIKLYATCHIDVATSCQKFITNHQSQRILAQLALLLNTL